MTDSLGSLVVLPFALAAPAVFAAGTLILWRERHADWVRELPEVRKVA